MNTVLISGWSVSSNYIRNFIKKNGFPIENILILNPSDVLKDYSDKTYTAEGLKSIYKNIDNILSSQDINIPFNLIGWSLGGMLALIYASYSNNKINELILVNTTSDFIMGSVDRLEALNKLTEGIKLDNEARDLVLKKFYYSLLKEDRDWNESDLPLAEELLQQSKEFNTADLIASLNFLRTINLDNEAKSITVKTKIICSENDLLIPPEHSQKLSKLIKHSKIETIKDKGHMMPIQGTPNLLFN